jgi:hypothetical protein
MKQIMGYWPMILVLATFFAGSAHGDLFFAEPQANGGTVRSAAPVVHHFTFVNQGPEAVQITGVQGSCGCLKPQVAKACYKPGEQGSVELEINTLSQAPGPHTWTVRLGYRDGSEPRETVLQFQARVLTEVMVQPATMVVYAERAAGHEVIVTDFRKKPLTITGVAGSSKGLEAQVVERSRDRKGHAVYRIRLVLAEDYPQGRHDDTLHIYSDDSIYADMKVPLTIIKRSPQHVAAVPDQVTLEAHDGQPLPARMVLLRDNSGQQVVIDQVMVDDPAITCAWAQGPNNMVTLKVRVDRSQIQGNTLRSAVHVRILKPVAETLTIPVNCTIE